MMKARTFKKDQNVSKGIWEKIFCLCMDIFLIVYLFWGLQSAFAQECNINGASPKDLKIITVDMLSELKNNDIFFNAFPDKKTVSKIHQAIFHINRSLKEKHWVDPWHLNWPEGVSAFNAEGVAARHLTKITKYQNENIKIIIDEALNNLVSADFQIARTALEEARSYANVSKRIKIYQDFTR